MTPFKNNPIAAYVVLVVLLSITPFALMFQDGNSESDLTTLLLMWIPALAAILHRLLIRQSLHKEVGWNPVRSVKWLLIAMMVPLVISITCVGLQSAFGFVEYNPAFLTMNDGLVQVHGVAMIFGAEPQPLLLFLGNFILSFFVGNLIYMIMFALGEEYGWRGHLQSLLLQKYSIRYTFIVLGIIWGLWHFPAILLGHNYPDHPVFGGMVLMPITCIAYSFVFGVAYLRANSLWVPVMFHSALNLSSGMDDKMIITKTNAIGADLVWTSVWIVAALLVYSMASRPVNAVKRPD